MALDPAAPNKKIQSIAICAGSGESVLMGVDADVYFTGEMGHVRTLPTTISTTLSLISFITTLALRSRSCCLRPQRHSLYVTGSLQQTDHRLTSTYATFSGGHSNTERGYLPVLAFELQQQFRAAQDEEKLVADQLLVHVSKEDKDPLEVV